VLHVECRLEDKETFDPDKEITFLFSPIEPNQPDDGTIKLGFGEHTGAGEYRDMKPYRALRSSSCPYCKEDGETERVDQREVQEYYENMEWTGEVRCGFSIDGDVDSDFASDNTGSLESWRRINEWMEICDETHEECSRRRLESSKEPYPTRMLDLGVNSREEGDVRLVISKTESVAGRYMTLSHCWGNLCIKTLTTGNLAEFRSRISFAELSKTFQEAIVVTRKLGIRYLWIDSLCIIQEGEGSKDDWLHESGMMDSIYQNSFLNIGATSAYDGNGGCFRERNYEKVSQPIFYKPACKMHPDKCRNPYRLVEDSFFEDTILSEPLLQRGWVFQERFLSPRMLHFGTEQLFWECNQMQVCESYPHHLLKGPPRVALDRLEPERSLQLHNILTQQRGNYKWHDIVEEYSTKKLTRGEDKLIALSGVARQYATRMLPPDTQYLAGIWATKNFPQELLWTVDDPKAYRSEEWRAPTWSWASLEGKISAPLGGDFFQTPLTNNVGVLMGLINLKNRFGPFNGGHISLEGKLICLDIFQRSDNTYGLSYKGRNLENSFWYPDEREAADLSANIVSLSMTAGRGGLVGLTLRREDDESNRYYRTGVFKLWPEGVNDGAIDWFYQEEPFDQLKGLDSNGADFLVLI
jgi:hypothetical protein